VLGVHMIMSDGHLPGQILSRQKEKANR
jgi:hypothetical protein